jgi:hypothetical protein
LNEASQRAEIADSGSVSDELRVQSGGEPPHSKNGLGWR